MSIVLTLFSWPHLAFLLIAGCAAIRCVLAAAGALPFAEPRFLDRRLSWLGIGKVPAPIICLILFACWWLLSSVSAGLIQWLLPNSDARILLLTIPASAIGSAIITRIGLAPLLHHNQHITNKDPITSHIGRSGRVISQSLGPDGGSVRIRTNSSDTIIEAWCHEHDTVPQGSHVLLVDQDDDNDERYRAQPLRDESGAHNELESGAHQILID